MFNTKKKFIFILFFSVFLVKSFADFTISPKISVDLIKDDLNAGIGISMGMGFHRGHTFFIDAIAGYNGAGIYTITTNLDWHILPWNLGVAQLYLGLGAGVRMPIDPKGSLWNPIRLSVSGRIPIGLKFFFGTVELYFEASPLLNWLYTSYGVTNSAGQITFRTDTHGFNWGVQASTGLRVWW